MNAYTLSFRPINYAQNLKIIVLVPKQIRFGSNVIKCSGVQGTDSEALKCDTDLDARTVTINNAVTF